MANVVLQVKAFTIEEMQAYYKNSLGEKIPPGSVFTAKVAQCNITAYKSG